MDSQYSLKHLHVSRLVHTIQYIEEVQCARKYILCMRLGNETESMTQCSALPYRTAAIEGLDSQHYA